LAAVAPRAGLLAAHAGEEGVEEIAEAAEALTERRAAAHVDQSGSTDHVVDLAALGIRKDLIGLVDLLEPVDRLSVVVDVRMPLLSQFAEGALDLRVVGGALDAQDFVVAPLRCHA